MLQEKFFHQLIVQDLIKLITMKEILIFLIHIMHYLILIQQKKKIHMLEEENKV